MHPNTFFRIVQEEAGLNDLEEAKHATEIVFRHLSHRITKDEAEDVDAQLPTALKKLWKGQHPLLERLKEPFSRPSKETRIEFVDAVEQEGSRLNVPGEKLTQAVFYALQQQLTEGEANDVAAQLPKDLRTLWQSSKPLAPYVGGGGEAESVDVYSPGSEERF